jgi:hypothetical protein
MSIGVTYSVDGPALLFKLWEIGDVVKVAEEWEEGL